MKVLDLQCPHGHRFEGWFASADDFESQQSRKLVECPICGANEVSRLPSAPRLNLSGATEAKVPADAGQRQARVIRAAIRAGLEAHLPGERSAKVLNLQRLNREDFAGWHKLLGTRGWSVIAWPKESGGPGWDATQRHIWDEECARIGAPSVLPFGVS